MNIYINMEINNINLDECIYCFEPIKEELFENKPYVFIPNCFCNYTIHYSCLQFCLLNKNQCLYCYKPFSIYKNKKYRPKKDLFKKLMCCFSLGCC